MKFDLPSFDWPGWVRDREARPDRAALPNQIPPPAPRIVLNRPRFAETVARAVGLAGALFTPPRVMARNLEGGRPNVAGGGERSSFTFYVFVVILGLMVIAAGIGNRQSASTSTSVALPPEESTTAFEVFVVTWPLGFCSMYGVTCTEDLINNKWVAHGIWGARADGTLKTNCPVPVVLSYYQELMHAPDHMKQRLAPWYGKWVGLTARSNLQSQCSFWWHEYGKHAGCLKKVLAPKELGQKILRLYNRYRMEDILRGGNVVPGNGVTYPLEAIYNAVRSYEQNLENINLPCIPRCIYRGHMQVLTEVWLCIAEVEGFTKMVGCEEQMRKHVRCRATSEITVLDVIIP